MRQLVRRSTYVGTNMRLRLLGANGAPKQFFESLQTATIDAEVGEVLQLEISNGNGIVPPRRARVVVSHERSKPRFDIGKKGTIIVDIEALFHEQTIEIVAYPVQLRSKNGFKSAAIGFTGSLRFKSEGDAGVSDASFIRAEHGQVEHFVFMLRVKEEKRS